MTSPVPSLGDIVYLASYLFQVGVEAQTTMPDTPNQYSAKIGVMGDQGDLNLEPLMGATGPAGAVDLVLRRQTLTATGKLVNNSSQLPRLTNTPTDIGKYFLLDDLDDTGHVSQEWAYIWYGASYRRVAMGAFGPPGPVPKVNLEIELTEPGTDAFVATAGQTLAPVWTFKLPVPQGEPGPVSPLWLFDDFDSTFAPQPGYVVGFTGGYNTSGEPMWGPISLDQVLPTPYSVPESHFNTYVGVSQSAPIASFEIPPQTFAYTPIVWGHIGGNGISLSSDPFMIGCQVLLGDQVTGVQVARGLGGTLGVVNIYPHYSYAAQTSQAITPTNDYAVVQPFSEGPASTLYINLWNDGQIGVYAFDTSDAQVFVQCLPVNPKLSPTNSLLSSFDSEGKFEAVVTKQAGF